MDTKIHPSTEFPVHLYHADKPPIIATDSETMDAAIADGYTTDYNASTEFPAPLPAVPTVLVPVSLHDQAKAQGVDPSDNAPYVAWLEARVSVAPANINVRPTLLGDPAHPYARTGNPDVPYNPANPNDPYGRAPSGSNPSSDPNADPMNRGGYPDPVAEFRGPNSADAQYPVGGPRFPRAPSPIDHVVTSAGYPVQSYPTGPAAPPFVVATAVPPGRSITHPFHEFPVHLYHAGKPPVVAFDAGTEAAARADGYVDVYIPQDYPKVVSIPIANPKEMEEAASHGFVQSSPNMATRTFATAAEEEGFHPKEPKPPTSPETIYPKSITLRSGSVVTVASYQEEMDVLDKDARQK